MNFLIQKRKHPDLIQVGTVLICSRLHKQLERIPKPCFDISLLIVQAKWTKAFQSMSAYTRNFPNPLQAHVWRQKGRISVPTPIGVGARSRWLCSSPSLRWRQQRLQWHWLAMAAAMSVSAQQQQVIAADSLMEVASTRRWRQLSIGK